MKILIALLIITTLSGCAQVIVQKPDNTLIKVNVFGSTKIDDMRYRRADIDLQIGQAELTPEHLAMIAEAVARGFKPLL